MEAIANIVETPFEKIDRLEVALNDLPQVEFPTESTFTPGLYCRKIFMPAGSFLTSKIHKTEHPYVVTQGVVDVWIDGDVETIRAPHFGITMPNTRRVLHVKEDTVWATYHPTNKTTVEEVEDEIIIKRDAHLKLSGDEKVPEIIQGEQTQ